MSARLRIESFLIALVGLAPALRARRTQRDPGLTPEEPDSSFNRPSGPASATTPAPEGTPLVSLLG